MKAFIVSEIIWSAYTLAVILLTHTLLLPLMFYFSGWAIYGLAALFVKGLSRYHEKLLKRLAERPGDTVEALVLPSESTIKGKYLEGCGNCDC